MSSYTKKYLITVDDLNTVFDALVHKNYQNIGPVLRDGAIMLDRLSSFTQLPRGIYEIQDKAHYRIEQKEDGTFFQYTVGPQSFKRFLMPPRRKLWGASKEENNFKLEKGDESPGPMAFWGVRACELKALDILDEIFIKDDYKNEWYAEARSSLFILSVGCSQPADQCFCTTMGTGPDPSEGFDLKLIELTGEEHFFLLQVGSKKGGELIHNLGFKEAGGEKVEIAKTLMDKAEGAMKVRFDREEIREMLPSSQDHFHWEEVAAKCLGCANCTLVCPTCFCSETEDITDITGDHTERWVRWDSCFNRDFSFIHGGVIRPTIRSRYRQWLTHKLSNWYEQFGSAGCVGCGRCIVWCPVGIDLTEEVNAMSADLNESLINN